MLVYQSHPLKVTFLGTALDPVAASDLLIEHIPNVGAATVLVITDRGQVPRIETTREGIAVGPISDFAKLWLALHSLRTSALAAEAALANAESRRSSALAAVIQEHGSLEIAVLGLLRRVTALEEALRAATAPPADPPPPADDAPKAVKPKKSK